MATPEGFITAQGALSVGDDLELERATASGLDVLLLETVISLLDRVERIVAHLDRWDTPAPSSGVADEPTPPLPTDPTMYVMHDGNGLILGVFSSPLKAIRSEFHAWSRVEELDRWEAHDGSGLLIEQATVQ